MKKVLLKLFEHRKLNKEEAKEILQNISKGKYNEAQIAAFITVYLMRAITMDELSGFREALLELCIPVDFRGIKSIDLCGTGGDGKNTFNISTLASFVVAGAGYKVTKHGNYGVSSTCGSSNVLEFLGYTFSNDNDVLLKQLDRSNFCFMHAPLFHPAMKTVGPVRRQLRLKTFFNMLGPLVNPSRPSHQLVGVFSNELLRLYHYIFQHTAVRYQVIHSLDGYDEISLTGPVRIRSNQEASLVEPADIGMPQYQPSQLFGGNTVKEAADLFVSILSGAGEIAQNNVVISNAAFAIKCIEEEKSITDCIEIARTSLESGAAYSSLKSLVNS